MQAAFASLDAASSSNEDALQHETLRRLVGSEEGGVYVDEVGSCATSLVAMPRQVTSDSRRRPLIGGVSGEEMQNRAQKRWQRWKDQERQSIQQDGVDSQCGEAKTLSGNHGALRFPFRRASDCWSGKALQSTLMVAPVLGRSDVVVSTIPSGSESGRDRTTQRRMLTWAARRDRRDARRRPSPPLTRRRAQQQASQASAHMQRPASSTLPPANQSKDGHLIPPCSSEPARTDPSTTSEITDPSIGDGGSAEQSVAAKKHRATANGRRAAQTRVSRPQLDMTMTEPIAPQIPTKSTPPQNDSTDSATQSCSQTQSEPDQRQERVLHPNDLAIITSEALSSGSLTEEEADPSFMETTNGKRSGQGRRGLRKPPSKQASWAEKELASARIPARMLSVSAMRRTKQVARGRPLFEGLVFALTGFWGKVKMYEKLVRAVALCERLLYLAHTYLSLCMQIDKHAGTLARRSGKGTDNTDPFAGVTHVVFCPHGTLAPDRDSVYRAVKGWCHDRADYLAALQVCLDSNGAELIEARWISDCIESCLRKDELLPVKKYRIAR